MVLPLYWFIAAWIPEDTILLTAAAAVVTTAGRSFASSLVKGSRTCRSTASFTTGFPMPTRTLKKSGLPR